MAEGRGGVVKLSLTTDFNVGDSLKIPKTSKGPECRVVVELDGAAHEGPLEIERDEDANHWPERTEDSRDAIREQSRLREY